MTKLAPDPLFGMSSPQPREITLTLQEPGASALVVARSRSPNTSPEPTALSDGKESLSFSYLGPLLASTTSAGTVSGKVSYTYDARLRVKTESVNDTSVISYGYDTDNTLLSATVDGVVLEHKRNNKGQVASSTLSKGNTVLTTTSYTYDAVFGELSSIQVKRNGTPLFSYTIEQRDNLGREKIRLEATATGVVRKSFEYDAAGRLSKSKTCSDTDTLCAFPVQTQTMSYDDNGNFVAQFVDDQDRLTSASGISYEYNAEGWRTGKKVSVLASSFSYHPLGHLLSVKGMNGTAAYTVDPLGRRIVAKGAIANTPFERRFLYRDSLRPAAELDASNSLRSRFVYASGRNVPDFFLLNGTPFLLVTDVPVHQA